MIDLLRYIVPLFEDDHEKIEKIAKIVQDLDEADTDASKVSGES